MMRVSFTDMKNEFNRILLNHSFSENKAGLCADIFAKNSLDGVYSHGLNRFPVFISQVIDKSILPHAEPELISNSPVMEQWDGNLAPGMYLATLAMKRSIEMANENGIGAVAVRNSNHWMRGGTYGWQAADAGCIGICMTNTIANMPPWGGKEARLGNNPLIIAIPRKEGNIVLDMAVSQYSYGKMQEYLLKQEALPFPGGFDADGNLSTDASSIMRSKRTLPIGFWKGSGLAMMIDLLVISLSGGRSTARISQSGKEFGLSQFFLSIHPQQWDQDAMEEIISYAKSSALAENSNSIQYPGEGSLAKRKENLLLGIPVQEQIWNQVLSM